MSSLQRDAPSQGRFGQSLRIDRAGRLNTDEVGDGPCGRSAAERTNLKIGETLRDLRMAGLAMQAMHRCLQLKPLRADFQFEWRTARRHEAERHIGSKQKQRQRQTGRYVSPPMMNEQAHGLLRTMPECAAAFHCDAPRRW